MSEVRTVITASDAAREMMKSLGLVGSFDVRYEGSRHTGWVGRPGDGDDVAMVVTIETLPPIEEEASGR